MLLVSMRIILTHCVIYVNTLAQILISNLIYTDLGICSSCYNKEENNNIE